MEKILVVDDEPKITRVIRAYLEKEGFEVDEVHDGDKALQLAEGGSYDLMILDLMLPSVTGEEITKRLRRGGSALPIIMLTAKGAEQEKIQGLGLGADDYLVKPFSPAELIARVYAVLRRCRASAMGLFADVLEFAGGKLVVDTLRHQVTFGGEKLELTATEHKLLATMARCPGRVFTRGELLEVAQGMLPTGFDRTVDSHIKNLRRKLELIADQHRFIHTVYGVGYKFEGD